MPHILRLRRDPRDFQISVLGALLLYGITALDFDVTPGRALSVIAAAQATQWLCTKLWRLPRFDPKSAMISSLSLCLLLRTAHLPLALGAIAIAIASKFLLRIDGRHVFNPTALALIAMELLSDSTWISPGLWGSGAFLAFFFACGGGLVVNRSSRSDVTYAFFASYALLLFARALWLGDPMAIPLHQLQSGSLLLFTFFMISDPKTTPNARVARIAYGGLVALGAGFVHFVLFEPNGFVWSLVCLAPTVPVLNRLWPATAFQWHQAPQCAVATNPTAMMPTTKGQTLVSNPTHPADRRAGVLAA